MNAVAEPAIIELPSLREIFGALHCRPDVPNEVYHADRSCVSSSGLKEILRSPAHFQAYRNIERKETPALFLGTAIHARLLEPELFAEDYVVAPGSDRRTKEYKEFEIANANKKILTAEQAAVVEGIALNASRHQSASALLRSGLVEHTIIWQDEETGIWMKIRPDCLSVDFETGICLDVKSTEDAAPEAFARSCVTYDYDVQAALYLEGLRAVFKRDFDFCFFPVEKSEPFGVALYGASDDMLRRGTRRVRQALRLLKQCFDRDEWPSYQPDGGYEVLEWPRWAA